MDEAVDSASASPIAMAAIRLLMLTGCRKSEILTLRWTDVDLEAGELHLADAKAGPRAVQLPPTAVRLLEALPRREGCRWVFPGEDREGRFSAGGLDHVWQTVRTNAELEDVRLHDLRHRFASHAVLQGVPLPVVSRLLGHKRPSMTLRYAHVGDRETEAAAERIGAAIARALNVGATGSIG